MEAVETAPAQAESTAPVLTPAEQAAVNDDLPAFKEARIAERIERAQPKLAPTPAAPAAEPVAAAPAKVEDAPKPVSKRQQDINERIREAVQRGIDEDRARRAAPQTAAPADEFPDYPEWAEKNQDKTFRQYLDAHRSFSDEQASRAQMQSVRQRDDITQKQTELATAQARVAEALADPAFEARFKAIPPAILELPTRQLLEATQRQLADQRDPRAMQVVIGPENDFASEIVKSKYFPQLIVLAHEEPSVMAQVRACDDRREIIRLVADLENRFKGGSTAAPAAPPKTLTSAPDLGTTLGNRSASPADPIAAAVQSDNLRAFKEARLAQRLAKTRR